MVQNQAFVFNYSSPFSYGSNFDDQWLNDDSDHDHRHRKRNLFQQLLYVLLISCSVIFFLVTFPISSFFYVKRINSLQRCLIYRLGRRLPLKGPGFFVALPFIDHTRIIDLYETKFDIVENEQQMLTGDGSIICIQPCQATLNVTDALLTTSKVNNVDVKQFLRLRFANFIRSKHVEDLENKMNFLLRSFEEDMNAFLKKWGYAINLWDMPRIAVLDRADPMSPIKARFKKWFEPDDGPFSSLSLEANSIPEQTNSDGDLVHRLAATIQLLMDPYKTFLEKYDTFNLKVNIDEGEQIFYFQYVRDQGLTHIGVVPPVIHMTVEFSDLHNLNQFLMTRDTKFVTYKIH